MWRHIVAHIGVSTCFGIIGGACAYHVGIYRAVDGNRQNALVLEEEANITIDVVRYGCLQIWVVDAAGKRVDVVVYRHKRLHAGLATAKAIAGIYL